MADLIERINARLALMAAPPEWADKPVYVDAEPVRAVLREAVAALEAAREDAERLEWLADQMRITELHDILGSVPLEPCDLRTAIDQARGKGGAGK